MITVKIFCSGSCLSVQDAQHFAATLYLLRQHGSKSAQQTALCALQDNRAVYPASSKVISHLTAVSEELPDVPLYFSLHDVCKTVKCTPPKAEVLRSALINAGQLALLKSNHTLHEWIHDQLLPAAEMSGLQCRHVQCNQALHSAVRCHIWHLRRDMQIIAMCLHVSNLSRFSCSNLTTFRIAIAVVACITMSDGLLAKSGLCSLRMQIERLSANKAWDPEGHPQMTWRYNSAVLPPQAAFAPACACFQAGCRPTSGPAAPHALKR